MSSNLEFSNNSLKSKLYHAIKGAFPYVFMQLEVEQLARLEEYKISNAERRCRELTDEGVIEPIFNDTKRYIKGYRFIPPVNNSAKTISTNIDTNQKALF